MSQTTYTNETSAKYRGLANSIRHKINTITNNHEASMIRYEGIPAVLEKGNLLIMECDNIANNWMTDTDYIAALLRVEAAINELVIALNNWNNAIYVVPLSSVRQLENTNNDTLSI